MPDGLPETASTPNGRASVDGNGAGRDSETFGGDSKANWDQFETNARLFGTKTSWQEELYTTKLNRSGADFKKREKDAERLAGEIMNVSPVAERYGVCLTKSANLREPACCRGAESDGGGLDKGRGGEVSRSQSAHGNR